MIKTTEIKSLLKGAPLFLVIAIDSMGLGILFPILSALLISHNSLFLSASISNFSRELIYGVTIGIYMIAWFFGSAMLGDLSDSMGRKKSLMICLIGAVLIGMSVALLYSLLTTLFSNQVSSDEQGWVMGITNSVSALSFGITSLMSGFAADLSPSMPIYLGCVALALAALVLKVTRLATT